MSQLQLKINPKVAEVFDNYPEGYQEKLRTLRQLVVSTAEELPEVTTLEETLKWGEPSYLAKKGSTIRMDWKKKKPDQYALYFKCTSKLVETFRTIYGDTFAYENNRALLFTLEDELPVEALKHCISMALNYHHLKHLPLLGAEKIKTRTENRDERVEMRE